MRSSLSQLAVLCSPADRHCTACCGHLVPTDRVFVSLQTDTARLVAAIWFQPTVFLFPCRPILYDSLRTACFNGPCFVFAGRQIQHSLLRSVSSAFSFPCRPIGLQQGLLRSVCSIWLCLICLHTDRARLLVITVFQLAVFGLPAHRYSTAFCYHCVPVDCV